MGELYPSFLLLLLACYVQVTFCTPKRGGGSLCGRWPMSASPRCKGKRSVEDQGMQEQDFGIKIDYGTPGPILEPNQDEVIGHDRDENIMESGQNLNRRGPWTGLCPFTGRCKRSVEDQDMDQEQDNVNPILEPQVIGQDQDENIMESGQDLNRIVSGCHATQCRQWCRRCRRNRSWCRSCRSCRRCRGKRSVGEEDQGMDMEQDAVVSGPGFAYSDLNRMKT